MKIFAVMRIATLAVLMMSVSGCAGLLEPPEPPAPIEDRARQPRVVTPPPVVNPGARAIPLPEQPRFTAKPLISKPAASPGANPSTAPQVAMTDKSPTHATPEMSFPAEALPPQDEGLTTTMPSDKPAAADTTGSEPPPPAFSPAVQSLVNAANSAAAEQNWDRAQAALERAVKLAPSKSTLWRQLAYTHLKSGNLERAREVVQRALSLAAADGHENVAAWRLLGDIEQARGDAGAAQMARANATRLLH